MSYLRWVATNLRSDKWLTISDFSKTKRIQLLSFNFPVSDEQRLKLVNRPVQAVDFFRNRKITWIRKNKAGVETPYYSGMIFLSDPEYNIHPSQRGFEINLNVLVSIQSKYKWLNCRNNGSLEDLISGQDTTMHISELPSSSIVGIANYPVIAFNSLKSLPRIE